MSICLSLKDISYKNILYDINLDLEPKKMYILTGPTGSGKTILSKCIAGLINCRGKIEKENIESISYLGDINSFVKKTVLDNIIFSLENSGKNKTESRKKAYDVAKKIGITDLLFKKEQELSYSEKKIAMFAILVSKETDLIIIDDEFDISEQHRKKIIKYLKKLSKTSTVLFVSNKKEDLLLADNIIIMSDGKIIKNECKSEILKDEKLLIKNKINAPFSYQLSSKLVAYNLLKQESEDLDDIIGELWK